MKKIPSFCIFGLLVVFSSCLRLDSMLFNPEEKISAYQWDNYQGTRELPDLPDSFHVDFSRRQFFFLHPVGGERIACIFLGDSNQMAGSKVILYCHGNKNHMDNYWNRAKLLYHLGRKGKLSILMMDYRGFGLSTGNPTEQGMYDDVYACMQWLKKKGLPRENLIMYGYSLGSAPATKWASDTTLFSPESLILEAPFASAEMMVQDAAKLQLPASYFTNLKIDNAREIKKIRCSFLWLHGEDDDFLDYQKHGQQVFANAPSQIKKVAVTIPGAGHNDVPKVMGYATYLQALSGFLE